MGSGELEALQARAAAMQSQVDSMLAVYKKQLSDAAEARQTLATSSAEGWSADRLVRVTANAAGIPLDTWVDPQRRTKVTAEQLAAAMTEASQAAARAAKAQLDQAIAPVTAATAEMNLAELFPDTPELAKPVTDLLPPAPPPRPPAAQPASNSLDEPDFLQQWKPASPSWQPNPLQDTAPPAPALPTPAQPQANASPYGVRDEEDEPVWKGLRNNNDWW